MGQDLPTWAVGENPSFLVRIGQLEAFQPSQRLVATFISEVCSLKTGPNGTPSASAADLRKRGPA